MYNRFTEAPFCIYCGRKQH